MQFTVYEPGGTWFDPHRPIRLASSSLPRLSYKFPKRGRYFLEVGAFFRHQRAGRRVPFADRTQENGVVAEDSSLGRRSAAPGIGLERFGRLFEKAGAEPCGRALARGQWPSPILKTQRVEPLGFGCRLQCCGTGRKPQAEVRVSNPKAS